MTGGGAGEGTLQGACGMDNIITAIFRNIIYHRTLSLGSLNLTPGQLNQNPWRNSEILSGKSRVCTPPSMIPLRSAVWLFVAYSTWHSIVWNYESSHSFEPYWSEKLKIIEVLLHVFLRHSPTSIKIPHLLQYILMLNTIVFIITGEFLVRTLSSMSNLCVEHSIRLQ